MDIAVTSVVTSSPSEAHDFIVLFVKTMTFAQNAIRKDISIQWLKFLSQLLIDTV